MHSLLQKLFEGEVLEQFESQTLFQSIIAGKLESAQLAGALVAMKIRGEKPQEIAGAANALLLDAKPFPRPDYPFADIVGTGGDGANTINVSTASAVVAATLGYKIAKHGNKSVSSKSGSSDLLNAFGISLNLPPETSKQALDNLNLCFLFAPHYHTGFKHAVEVRQSLKTRTIFNVLGPLINPARPPFALIGVYNKSLIRPIAETLHALHYQKAIVVHGNGLDEITVDGETEIAELKDGKIVEYTVAPEDFGLSRYPIESLVGGCPLENKRLITQLLQGHGEKSHNTAVALNVSMLMRLFGEDDLKANAQKVLNILASGECYQTIQKLALMH
ncbi:anthranilate phosphoribosyltransferase [Thorsellia kenyensis]|uniref:Anthranilate phosphoribosyltransferase n=1 Tax=Thorsellia kenyensis TaxID=1549888 RepID=A0ABV6CCA8_9GAMM